MDFRRTATVVVFMMSSLFLVDAWQRHNGHAGFMGQAPKPVAAVAATNGAAATPASPFADSVPVAPTSPVDKPADTVGVVAPVVGQILKLGNDVLAIEVATAGGSIVRAELLKHLDDKDSTKNVVLLDGAQAGKHTYLAQTGLSGMVAGKALPNHTNNTVFTVVKQTPNSVVLEAMVEGVKLTKTIALTPNENNYGIAVTHAVTNAGATEISPSLYLQLKRHGVEPDTGNFITRPVRTFTGFGVYTEAEKFQKIEFTDIDKGKVKYNPTVKDNQNTWIAAVQHYFVSAWVPKAHKAQTIDVPLPEEKAADGTRLYRVNTMQALGAIAPGATVQHEATLYIGPQDQAALEKLATGLRLVVDYGVFKPIAEPMFALLSFLHSLVGNWGWAIILLTLSVKALMYLPMAMSYRSMAKMKNVGPKMKALKERYGDDKVKLQTATMELYRTEKINPLSGCLPILLTIPVFMSLYWTLLSSVEMRNAPWIGWITNLAAADPLYILPVLLLVTMIVQFKLSPTPPDPTQAKMMMVMQGVFSLMFAFFPAGLNIYYLVNNTLSILQQWYITRQLEKEGLQAPKVKAAKPIKAIKANKLKTPK
jgi:YidC/Oxa1 family membrane protein insertase